MAYDIPVDESSKAHLGRRSFLSRTMAMGMVTGFLPNTPKFASTELEPVCKASPADSLLLYLDLLIRVQSYAFDAASSVIITAADTCRETLKNLQDQVKILEREIQSARTSAQARQMREVAEIGRAQAELIKASHTSGRKQSLAAVNSLDAVSSNINRTAEELMQHEIKLTAKARKALLEVIRLVREFQEVPEQTKAAQEEYQQRVKEIRTKIEGIRNDFFAASASAADAEAAQSSTGEQEARNKAIELIDSAKAKLEALRPNPTNAAATRITPSTQPAAQAASPRPPAPIDLLVGLLDGTKRWLENPQLISLAKNGRRDVDGFLPVTFHHSVSTAQNLYSRVWNAIDGCCPRATDLRTLWCVNLIAGTLTFPDKATRIPLIAGVLLLFPCWRGNKNALVLALADL